MGSNPVFCFTGDLQGEEATSYGEVTLYCDRSLQKYTLTVNFDGLPFPITNGSELPSIPPAPFNYAYDLRAALVNPAHSVPPVIYALPEFPLNVTSGNFSLVFTLNETNLIPNYYNNLNPQFPAYGYFRLHTSAANGSLNPFQAYSTVFKPCSPATSASTYDS